MSVTQDMGNQKSTLREEASLHFARSLSDRFDVEDRRALDLWLAADQSHVRAYNEARSIWKAMQALQHDPELLALVAPQRPSRQRWAIAASLAVVTIGAALWWQFTVAGVERYSTQPWEQRSISFNDGSSALLSANTEIEVRTRGDNRNATVMRGEAVFDIVTDKARPFVVHTGDANVIVTGTRFQVRNQDGQVAITLVEGVIHLQRERYQYEQKLEPGEQVAFVKNEPKAELRKVDVDTVTTWKRDQLVFRDAPLSEALREANRHASLQLVLEDDSLGSILVNGHFRSGDTESLLAAIQGSFPLQVKRIGDTKAILARAD